MFLVLRAEAVSCAAELMWTDQRTKPMAAAAFLLATAAVVGIGVALRRLLPPGGFAALPLQGQTE